MTDREVWVDIMYKMAEPVLKNMAEGTLQKNMELELSPTWDGRNKKVTYMECFGRLMAGLAPWLSLPDDDTAEGKQRKQLREWALKSYAQAVDPQGKDYLLWRKEGQTLVDAAYVAESFLRGYDALWMPLDSLTKQRYIEEFSQLRRVDPPYTNWVLFSSTVECFLRKAGAKSDTYRIVSSLRKVEEWYVGDGFYSDGPGFAFDYYNSFVIHPMLTDVLKVMKKHGLAGSDFLSKQLKRQARYAEQLERMISPEGAYPAVGRSITYRVGAFHALAHAALLHELPKTVAPAQVRCGLTAVIARQFAAPRTFDEKGWLRIGFAGSQINMSETYINTGSVYLCTFGFLALGLPATDPFWTEPFTPWTGLKAWNGEDVMADHAIGD